MCLFPRSDVLTCGIEKPSIVPLANGLTCLRREVLPERVVLIVDLHVLILIRWSNLVGPEDESVRMAIYQVSNAANRFWASYDVPRNYVPGNIKIDVVHRGVIQN